MHLLKGACLLKGAMLTTGRYAYQRALCLLKGAQLTKGRLAYSIALCLLKGAMIIKGRLRNDCKGALHGLTSLVATLIYPIDVARGD